jgi:hypothetical protein
MHSSFSMANAATGKRQELIRALKTPSVRQIFLFMVLRPPVIFLCFMSELVSLTNLKK